MELTWAENEVIVDGLLVWLVELQRSGNVNGVQSVAWERGRSVKGLIRSVTSVR